MREIIIAAAFTLWVTPCHAWQTRYYKDPFLNQCLKGTLTQIQCLAMWYSLRSLPQHFGMTCALGPDDNTIDCEKE
jgi:hypothetical protein